MQLQEWLYKFHFCSFHTIWMILPLHCTLSSRKFLVRSLSQDLTPGKCLEKLAFFFWIMRMPYFLSFVPCAFSHCSPSLLDRSGCWESGEMLTHTVQHPELWLDIWIYALNFLFLSLSFKTRKRIHKLVQLTLMFCYLGSWEKRRT